MTLVLNPSGPQFRVTLPGFNKTFPVTCMLVMLMVDGVLVAVAGNFAVGGLAAFRVVGARGGASDTREE